jgi:hypothetical protein
MIVLTQKPSHNRHTLDFKSYFGTIVRCLDRFTEEALLLKNLIFIGEQVW